MSVKSFFTALSNPFARRRFIATALPKDAAGVVQPQYWSDHGLTTTPSESPANIFYEPYIKQALDFERFLFDRNKLEGRSIPSYGSLVLTNVDGSLDTLDDLVFDEQSVVIEMGEEDSARADYGIVFDGTAARAFVNEVDVQLRLRDLQWKLDKPMSKALYRGMGSALLFDGSNDYGHTNLTTYLSQNSETFELWVQAHPAADSRKMCWAHQSAAGSTTSNVEIRLNINGVIEARLFRFSASTVTITDPSGLDRRGTGWFHVALVVAVGANESKLYVNGELIVSGTAPTHTGTAAKFVWGADAGVGFRLPGQLDDIRYWTVARTQAEIRDNMNVELQGTETNLAAYWRCNEGTGTSAANKVASGAAITLVNGATFGSSMEGGADLAGHRKLRVHGYAPNARGQIVDSQKLIYQFSDTFVSSFDAVFDKGVLLTAGARYSSLYTFLTTTPAAGTYTMFPELGMIRLGFAAAGEITGNIVGDAPGKWGVQLDGVDDYMSAAVNCPAGNMTLECWVKPNSVPTATQRIFGYRGGATVAGNRHMGMFTGNIWITQVVNDAGTAFAVATGANGPTAVLQGDRWTHLALVLNVSGSLLSFYINGVPSGSIAISGTFNTVLGTLAAGRDANAATNFMNGGLDGLRLWSTARTQDQIRQNMFLRLPTGTTGLVGCWELEDATGTTALNTVSGGVSMTLNGGATWAGGWAPDSPALLARWIAAERAGVLDFAEMNLDAIYALQEATCPRLGFVVAGEEKCLDALDLVLNSCGGHYGFDRAGIFDVGRVDLPAGAPVKRLDTTVIKSVRMLEVPNPTWRQRVGWGRCWFVQSNDSLAGGATQAQRDFVSKAIRYAEQSNAATKTLWGEKEPVTVETALVRQYDADQLARRRIIFYGEKRRMYEVVLLAEGWDLDLGEEVTIEYPRFGLDAGINCRIIGFAESAARGQVRLYVWR